MYMYYDLRFEHWNRIAPSGLCLPSRLHLHGLFIDIINLDNFIVLHPNPAECKVYYIKQHYYVHQAEMELRTTLYGSLMTDVLL